MRRYLVLTNARDPLVSNRVQMLVLRVNSFTLYFSCPPNSYTPVSATLEFMVQSRGIGHRLRGIRVASVSMYRLGID